MCVEGGMVGGVCVEEGREEWKSKLMCWALVYAVVSECVCACCGEERRGGS